MNQLFGLQHRNRVGSAVHSEPYLLYQGFVETVIQYNNV